MPRLSSQAMIDQKLLQAQTAAFHPVLDEPKIDQIISKLSTDQHINIYKQLARFGIRSANDIVTFLKSPQGKILTAYIQKEMAELEQMRLDAEQHALHHQKSHFLALFLLALSRHSHADSDRTVHSVEEQIKHQHERYLEQAKTELSKEEKDFDLSILTAMATHIGDVIDYKVQHLEELDSELEHLVNQEHITISHHDNLIEKMDHFSSKIEHYTIDRIKEKIEKVKHHAQQVQSETAEDNSRMSDPSFKPIDNKTVVFNTQEQHYATLQQNLKLQALQDHLSVLTNKKAYYDKNGIETKSSKNAAFILKPGLQLVKDHAGRTYLIGANTNLSQLDSHEKQNAAQAYDKYKPKMNTAFSTMHQHFHNERQQHASRIAASVSQQELIKNELNVLRPQHHNITLELQLLQQQDRLRPNPYSTISPVKMSPLPAAQTSEDILVKKLQAIRTKQHEARKKQLHNQQETSPSPSPWKAPRPEPI